MAADFSYSETDELILIQEGYGSRLQLFTNRLTHLGTKKDMAADFSYSEKD